mgnify:FL=1
MNGLLLFSKVKKISLVSERQYIQEYKVAAEELTIWPGSPVVASMESGLESSVEAVVVGNSEDSKPNTPATVAITSRTDQKKVGGVDLILKKKREKRFEAYENARHGKPVIRLGKGGTF